MERLQKVISNSGLTSRRSAEIYIQDGRVKVNGQVVTEMGFKVKPSDIVLVDNKPLPQQDKVYFVMNKPRKVISTLDDEKGRPTVKDYINQNIIERIFPVGRLDWDTTGVLIFTNDGDLTNKLLKPNSNVEKQYLVRIDGLLRKDSSKKIEKGVDIGGYITKPARIINVEYDKHKKSSLVTLIIHEGKFHQVKRMFEAVGHPVKKLRRERFGNIVCEGLAPGEMRTLTIKEVRILKDLAFNPKENIYEKYDKQRTQKVRRYQK